MIAYRATADPATLPRALDHLDLVWHFRTGGRLFRRPGFARCPSLAAEAASAEEFDARCNAAYDVLSSLTIQPIDGVEGALNHLQLAMKPYLPDPGQRKRAAESVDILREVVAFRRGQAHAGASHSSVKAAARLGIRLNGDWSQSWDRVRHVMVQVIYTLSDELEPPVVDA